MACETLAELETELAARGTRLLFGNVRDRVMRDVERVLPPLPDGHQVSFPSVAEAATAALGEVKGVA